MGEALSTEHKVPSLGWRNSRDVRDVGCLASSVSIYQGLPINVESTQLLLIYMSSTIVFTGASTSTTR